MPFPPSGESKDVPSEHVLITAEHLSKHDSLASSDQTILDLAVHTIFDPITRVATGDDRYSDDLSDCTKELVKTVALFMKGRLPLAGLILSYAADEAKVNGSLQDQILDGAFGSSKALLIKGTFRALGRQGATPGMTGVGLGMASRVFETSLTRENYYDKNNTFSLSQGVETTLRTGLNPKAMTMDVITFATSDVLWARIMNHSRGTAWYKPQIMHAISGGTMGLTSEFGHELQRQVTEDQSVDTDLLMRKSIKKGILDAVAGGLGGLQSRRHSLLARSSFRDEAEIAAKARSKPYQKGLLADNAQVVLRDGTFILDKELHSLTTQTWVGWIRTPEGKSVRSIFRPNDGTESFAHRMQSEIAAYGLQKLGLKIAVPVTVAREINRGGKKYSGYIQEMEGISLAAFVKEKAANNLSRNHIRNLLASSKSFQESYSNAWLHRMIVGEWDNHALNMTVSQNQGKTVQVRNIDLADSLRPATSTYDLIPTPGVRQGYDRVNAKLYRELSGKKLDERTLTYLNEIHSQFSSPRGRSDLLSIGLTRPQYEGMLGRIDWLLKHKTMPVGREALFYLHLNNARRAFERWHGKRKT